VVAARAAVDDVKLMRETVGPKFDVKASAGIRDTKTALVMIEAGATRLGTSASVAIGRVWSRLNPAVKTHSSRGRQSALISRINALTDVGGYEVLKQLPH
jgi:hypothetical protein